MLQDEPIQSTCKSCPEGFYCNATFGPVVNYATYICPEGFYCPNGTRFPEEFPCPRGTFNNRTGRSQINTIQQSKVPHKNHFTCCLFIHLYTMLCFGWYQRFHRTLVHQASSSEFILLIRIFIPPATKLGGLYWNHPVRPSVRPSVDARG